MLTYILFVLGFVVLIKGADLLVSGASALAARLGVSALVIGLTIVAFGTSAPELVVNLFASWEGNTDIAIGNILGSNLANILLILGITALIYPLSVGKGTVWKEIPFALLAVVVLAVLVNDGVSSGVDPAGLSRSDGFILMSFFVIFLYYIFEIAKIGAPCSEEQEESPGQYSFTRSWVMITLGFIGLVIGGTWIVNGAVVIATGLGLSEALIGLTVIAIGTSLPELATSVVAAYRRNVAIAIGNIVGSNIFNILWILGISAIIRPLPFSPVLMTDLKVVFWATLFLFGALFVGRARRIDRWQGVLFVLAYLFYIGFIVLRN